MFNFVKINLNINKTKKLKIKVNKYLNDAIALEVKNSVKLVTGSTFSTLNS